MIKIEVFTQQNDFKTFEAQIISNLYEQNPDLKEKKQELKLKFALLEVQMNELIKVAKKTNIKHARMIETQLNCGLRVSELIHLSINQVNLEGKFLKIEKREKNRYVDAFKPKTKNSTRILPLSDKTIDILREQIDKKRNGYIFPSNKGGHFNKSSVIRFINKYARENRTIGFNIGSHSLRRTFASYLITDPKRSPGDE